LCSPPAIDTRLEVDIKANGEGESSHDTLCGLCPEAHKGAPIYAVDDGPEVDGMRPMVLREVTDPEKRKSAEQVPFYDVVKI
jgi:hypothetical protein